ncbi:hypothetical protein [Streptomyces cavernicola]|uniref:Uncharacterized protein n=1 Tax=Streptomyces cavernicola TaxID=3043613 RepID=A0ABT6SGK9_9ACTN|nr:hypothetical protein [Streptomyces sp. B-S-A6]MDI3407337.1 hypothetical protein [Streptomyces sp. B-S-A6]
MWAEDSSDASVGDRWGALDAGTRGEVDADVLRDRRLSALSSVLQALRLASLGGLPEAERLVHWRYEELADRVRTAPPDPLDVPSLAARAAAHPGRVAAVAALWDGDTVHGWYVLLLASLQVPDGEGHLATIRRAPDGPPPDAVAAEAGRALAEHLGVPFRFASPDTPADAAPPRR